MDKFDADAFERRLAGAIDADGLLAAGQSVLVGVSGGADSVAMLAALRVLAGEAARTYRLTVGHLDHSLRDESAGDAAFVAALARKWGLECITERVDVAAEADRLGEGVEHAARTARYEFFARAARQCGASAVAVAHHADDNAETILFRVLRGTALRGLAGMPVTRSLPAAEPESPALRIIRPMLGFRRREILDYCRARSLEWREDHTNAETVYRRNFLRHQLLPLIREKLNPQADDALLRLGRFAAQTEAYLTAQAEALLGRAVSHRQADRVLLDAAVFADEAPIIRQTAVRLAMESLGAPQRDLTAEHLVATDGLLNVSAGVVNLPGRFEARRRGSQIILAAK
jgi:tRNA(Ile)-lysidine synthase